MPKLLQSMVTVIDVFYEYASQDEECNMLKKKEMKALLENEFHQILKNPDDPDTVDIIMQSLDRDLNKKVDFTEYLLMIFKLAKACNKIISKDYCQASRSKQRDHSHWHHEEQSEEEDEVKRQGWSPSHSSCNAGEKYSYSRISRGVTEQNCGSKIQQSDHSSSGHRNTDAVQVDSQDLIDSKKMVWNQDGIQALKSVSLNQASP
ncbi:PREDICTED: hornerin-like [Condylura cristata]|uniref:hornerin-like n=1 Tax=Condylura cristata TaxID=143302 RepID=UPI000642C153|nr:PREDICTED: hornerin-like [Condylura cristata]